MFRLSKKIYFIILFSLLVVFNFVQAEDATTINGYYDVSATGYEESGLVPCGNDGTPCTLCHLFIGIKNIIEWGRNILIVAALVAIVIGGILYIISAGNSKMMEMGKNAVKQALWGVVIVLGAWVIVNTTLLVIGLNLSGDLKATSWYDFTCDTTSSVSTTETTAATAENATLPTATSGDNGVTTHTEQEVRDLFEVAGISINKKACAANQTSNCTNVGGLREHTIDGVLYFKQKCGDNCDVMINGGSEIVYDESGKSVHNNTSTYTHANGYKVDINSTSAVNEYIEKNFEKIPDRKNDGAIGYKDKSGNTYYREKKNQNGDHWDVTYY